MNEDKKTESENKMNYFRDTEKSINIQIGSNIKEDLNFKRITDNKEIISPNDYPLVIYKKKETKVTHSFDKQMKKKPIDKNIYISDGGLKKKLEKFNICNSNQQRHPIKSLQSYLKSINTNILQKSSTIKSKQKEVIKSTVALPKKSICEHGEQNIFYKTVRESSKRPAFPKVDKEKDRDKFKTRNNFMPKKKRNNETSNNTEDNKNKEEKRVEIISNLIQSAYTESIKKFQNNSNKLTPKELFVERKKIFLQRNGIKPSKIDLDEEQHEEKKEGGFDSRMAKTSTNFNSKSTSKSTQRFSPGFRNSLTLNNEKKINQKIKTKQKQNIKPEVDQFEYIKKIKIEKRRLCTEERKITDDLDEEMNNSFRHKSNPKKNEIKKINNYIKTNGLQQKKGGNPSSLVDVNNDEFPYSHKKSYRSPKELNKFVKDKKIKNKKEENDNELEKNKKLFLKFKNLYALNAKWLLEERNNFIDLNRNNKNRNKNKKSPKTYIKRKKEANEYYVGNDSFKRNNSTLVDPNEYYLNVLESQQLLVNSGFNKIDNDAEVVESDSAEENKDSKELNELNTSKEQIKKITEKESNRQNQKNIKKTKENVKPKKTNNELNLNIQNIENQSNKQSQKSIQYDSNVNNFNKVNNINNNNINPIESIIKPRALFNLIEIIKFIIQRKVLIFLYQFYINCTLEQKYKIAISYLIALFKQYPFRKIEEHCNYITYNKLFRQLIMPYIKRSFNIFCNNCYISKKLEFLFFAISRLFKFKIMEKILFYSQSLDTSEIKVFELVIMKIERILTKLYLQIAFDKIKNITLKKSQHQEVISIRDKENKNINKNNNNTNKNTNEHNNIKGKSIDHSFEHKKPDNSLKMNSYLYESLESESKNSLSVEPNSVDNDKLHQLKKIYMKKRNMMMNDNEEMEDDDDMDDNDIRFPQNNSINSKSSYKSEKSGKAEEKKETGPSIICSLGEAIRKAKNDITSEKKKQKEEKEKPNKNKNNKDINKIKEELAKNDSDKSINKGDLSLNDNEKKNKDISVKNEEPEEQKESSLISEKKKNNNNNEDDDDDNSIEEINRQKKKEEQINIDISAEKESNTSIDWGYELSSSKDKKKDEIDSNGQGKLDSITGQKSEDQNLKIEEELLIESLNSSKRDEVYDEEEKEPKKTLKKDKNNLNESEDEYAYDFEELKNNDIEAIEEEKKIQKEDIIGINNEIKSDKSRNINLASNEKNQKENNGENNDNNNKKDEKKNNQKEKQPEQKVLNIKQPEKLAEKLTKEIINDILETEIKENKKKLIPHKRFKYETIGDLSNSQSYSTNSGNLHGGLRDNLTKEIGLANLSELSLQDDNFSLLNDSIMSCYSAFSVFNRSVRDKKKEHSLNLYYKEIAPRLIKLIKEEIYLKYPRIYENISVPLKNHSIGLMISLAIQDANMLRDNYKCISPIEDIKTIIDKPNILKKFELINRQIRSKDNVTSDDFYDNMLNECIVDTAIELINKERIYGENGDPLLWSSRTHELVFKYRKNEPKRLADFVSRNILKTLHNRIGLITDNYDYLNAEQINIERDKRLIREIQNELEEDEYQWRNLEMEETQIKIEVTEMIMEQLFNENIEILEHIQYSRNRPDLYQNKSIYDCEEIPKLSFQQTTTENAAKTEEDS